MERDALVAALLAGEEDAWRQFVEELGPVIYAVAVRLGLRGPDQDDLFQSACLAVLDHLRELRDPERLASWVYGIALRRGLDWIRHERVSRESAARGALEAEEQVRADAASGLESLEEIGRVYDAVARTPARCRNLLRALYLEDPRPSYSDIARRERIPIGSIGPTRARCLERLRKILDEVSAESAHSSISRQESKGRRKGRRREGERTRPERR